MTQVNPGGYYQPNNTYPPTQTVVSFQPTPYNYNTNRNVLGRMPQNLVW